MKLHDQAIDIKNNFDISRHSFFKNIAEAVARKVFADANVKLSLSDKTVESGGKIKAVLSGFVSNQDENVVTDVQKSLNEIKTPTSLLNLLK